MYGRPIRPHRKTIARVVGDAMTTKNVAPLVIMAGLMAAISFRIARAWPQGGGSHISFSWVEVEQVLNPGGGPPVTTRTMLKAVRSDGAHAEATLDAGGRYLVRMVTLPNERRTTKIDEQLRLTSSSYMQEQTADRLRHYSWDTNCGNPLMTKIGEDVILGYKTHGFTVTGNDAQGVTQTATQWLAPDLEFVALRGSLQWTNNGRTGKTTKEVVRVSVGDLDPNLFKVPADYTEMSPSELERTRAAKIGHPLTPSLLDQVKERDRRYWESQKNKP